MNGCPTVVGKLVLSTSSILGSRTTGRFCKLSFPMGMYQISEIEPPPPKYLLSSSHSVLSSTPRISFKKEKKNHHYEWKEGATRDVDIAGSHRPCVYGTAYALFPYIDGQLRDM